VGGHVEFPNGAGAAGGYLATPIDGGAGPALIVLGPMLGLGANITSVCDRFAAEGFTALAPEVVAGGGTDQDRVVGVNLPVAIDGLRAAVGFLEEHPMVHGKGVGLAGFEAGARLALALAARASDDIKALVLVDGAVLDDEASADWAGSSAPAECHFALDDADVTKAAVDAVVAAAKERHVAIEAFTYQGAAPGFFDDTRPEVFDADAAHEAFIRSLSFLRAHLG